MSRLGFLAVLVIAPIVLASCNEDPIVVPNSAEPFLYVVIEPPGDAAEDSALLALLITAGSPLHSDYRQAQRFEMRRTSDGAQLDWRPLPVSGRAPIASFGTLPDSLAANYILPFTSPSALGRADIAPGDSFSLLLVSDGREIRGNVRVPDRPEPAVLVENGLDIVAWPPVTGALGYFVEEGEFCRRLTSDTVYVIGGGFTAGCPDSPSSIIVRAIDRNLYTYLAVPSAARSGIDSGFGVLGAITSAAVEIGAKP